MSISFQKIKIKQDENVCRKIGSLIFDGLIEKKNDKDLLISLIIENGGCTESALTKVIQDSYCAIEAVGHPIFKTLLDDVMPYIYQECKTWFDELHYECSYNEHKRMVTLIEYGDLHESFD